MEESLATGRFIVRTASKLIGRGTYICGYPESGVFHTGDDLGLSDGQAEWRARCLGVDMIQQRRPTDPPTVGLVVRGVQPSDFCAGIVIFAFPRSA